MPRRCTGIVTQPCVNVGSSVITPFKFIPAEAPNCMERLRPNFKASTLYDLLERGLRVCFISPLEEDKRAKHIVLLRGIFVFPEFRGNGLARFVIRTTTTIAENTGACVCAVCNPYSVAVSDDPETRTRWMYESFLFDYEDDYLEHQKSMRKRFSESGFQNWDISENIGNKERCTPEDCFIFIPSSADREFTNSIQYRIL